MTHEDRRLVTLAEACVINPPKPKLKAIADDTPVLFVPMAAVDEYEGVVAAAETRTLGELRRRSYRTFAPGDILFAKITPCMENGKSAIVPYIASGLAYGSTEFHVLRPRAGTNARYIWHLLRQPRFRRLAEERMTGSVGQARVPASFLEEHELSLPDEETQRAVAALLDEATSKLGSVRRRLIAVSNKLRELRFNTLHAASTGRLTNGWRYAHPRVTPPAVRDRRVELGWPQDGAPDTWSVVTVADVGKVHLGGTPARKQAEYWGGGIPWVSSGEVANCRIASTRETISQAGLDNSSAKLYPSGTVLVAMIGEGKTRGQAAILDIEAATNQNAAGIIPDRKIVTHEYLYRWALGQYEVTRAAGRGGNQPALNKEKVGELVIPVPPLEEQAVIIDRADAMLARIARAEERLVRSVTVAEGCAESLPARYLEPDAAA